MADIGLKIASSGMETAKARVDVCMHNIANANTPNYTEKRVIISAGVSGNTPNGVKIDEILSKVDQFLEDKLLGLNSDVSMSETISAYYKELQDTIAKPDDDSGIVQALTKFFNGIDEMGLDPSNPSTRIRMVDSAKHLANTISDIAFFLEKKRFEADQQIKTGIVTVNSYLSDLRQLGSSLLTQAKGTISYAQTEDAIRGTLRLLSEFIPVRHYFDKDGILNVKAKDADYQLVGRSLFQLEYTPANNIETFIEERGVNPIYIKMYDESSQLRQKVPMVYGGKSDSVTHYLSSGTLAGLLHVRDTYFPAIIKNIDQLATNVAQSVNQIHNKGVGAMPTTYLISEMPSTLATRIAGNGSMMLTVVDGEGNPMIASSGRDYIPALQLDLGAFRSGQGPGNFNMQALIDEINQHFETASSGTRVAFNGFYDLKLGVVAGGATGNLDLNLDAWAYSDLKDVNSMDLGIQAIRVNATGGAPVTLTDGAGSPITFPKNYSFQNGEHVRTIDKDGSVIRLNGLATTGYPYTVQMDVKTIVNGKSNTLTLAYEIQEPTPVEMGNINGIINKRFSVDSIANDTSNTAHIISSTRSSSILSASMAGDGDVDVTSPNQKGFLSLSTTDGARIVLDQRDSLITSVDFYQHALVGQGFAQSFRMNNLFHTECDIEGEICSAISMRVREDIVLDPNHISMNKAEEYRVGVLYNSTPSLYYGVGVGGTELVGEFQALGARPIHFDRTRDIPEADITLKDYAIQVVGVHNAKTIAKDEELASLSNKMQGVSGQIDSETGVNLDAQLGSVMFLQTLYAASAKGVTTIRELFRQLLEVF